MISTTLAIILLAAAFLLIFVTGLRLRRLGTPYGTVLLAIHKLIGLAAGVYLAITAFRDHQVTTLGSPAVAVTIVTLALFVVTIISGGLMSINKPMPAIVRRMHWVGPPLTLLSAAGTLYLLSVRL